MSRRNDAAANVVLDNDRAAQTLMTGNGVLDIDAVRAHVQVQRRKFKAGEHVYRVGQPFQSLFLIHAGVLKTSELAEDGREQVSGFCMRGDLVGAESIGLEAYSCDAVALESSEVWELPYSAILLVSMQSKQVHNSLTIALAGQLRHNRAWMLSLGTLPARRRVAAFLLDIAERQGRLGFSAHHFMLRMTRVDMSSFLALKHETVSRAMSYLDNSECISVKGREVRILNIDSLRLFGGRSAHLPPGVHASRLRVRRRVARVREQDCTETLSSARASSPSSSSRPC